MVHQAFAGGIAFTNAPGHSVNRVRLPFKVCTPEEASLCIQQCLEHGENIDHQSLQWFWKLVLNDLDQELCHCIMPAISGLQLTLDMLDLWLSTLLEELDS